VERNYRASRKENARTADRGYPGRSRPGRISGDSRGQGSGSGRNRLGDSSRHPANAVLGGRQEPQDLDQEPQDAPRQQRYHSENLRRHHERQLRGHLAVLLLRRRNPDGRDSRDQLRSQPHGCFAVSRHAERLPHAG